MSFVIDASIVAAWLLPEEYSDAAETVIASITAPCPIPSLFWFEIRNILAMSERCGRIGKGGALIGMERIRRLPLDDAGIGGDGSILLLAADHTLSAYDATYLALAGNRGLAIATLDGKLAAAVRNEDIAVLGSFAYGD